MPKPGWYGPAIDNWAPSDGGSHIGPVTIGVLHTVEGTAFYPNSNNYYGHSSFPHFTVWGKRVWQHISLGRAARALRNESGGVQTNCDGVIQIEVVGHASKPFTNDPDTVATLKALMRWIESQTEIPRSTGVQFHRYPRNGHRAQRMTNAQWVAYRGWCGHQHVPENTHEDPGAIDIDLLLDAAPLVVAQEDPDKWVVGAIRDRWVAFGGVEGFLKAPLTKELTCPDGWGRYNHFQGGSIYWTPDLGAHVVYGQIRVAWERMGWEAGSLGYPVGEEQDGDPDHRVQQFQHGSLDCDLTTGRTLATLVAIP